MRQVRKKFVLDPAQPLSFAARPRFADSNANRSRLRASSTVSLSAWTPVRSVAEIESLFRTEARSPSASCNCCCASCNLNSEDANAVRSRSRSDPCSPISSSPNNSGISCPRGVGPPFEIVANRQAFARASAATCAPTHSGSTLPSLPPSTRPIGRIAPSEDSTSPLETGTATVRIATTSPTSAICRNRRTAIRRAAIPFTRDASRAALFRGLNERLKRMLPSSAHRSRVAGSAGVGQRLPVQLFLTVRCVVRFAAVLDDHDRPPRLSPCCALLHLTASDKVRRRQSMWLNLPRTEDSWKVRSASSVEIGVRNTLRRLGNQRPPVGSAKDLKPMPRDIAP